VVWVAILQSDHIADIVNHSNLRRRRRSLLVLRRKDGSGADHRDTAALALTSGDEKWLGRAFDTRARTDCHGGAADVNRQFTVARNSRPMIHEQRMNTAISIGRVLLCVAGVVSLR